MVSCWLRLMVLFMARPASRNAFHLGSSFLQDFLVPSIGHGCLFGILHGEALVNSRAESPAKGLSHSLLTKISTSITIGLGRSEALT